MAGSLQGFIDSAAAQVTSIERAGLLLGWLVFLIPVVLLVVIWLPARIRFFLRARAAREFLDSEADLDLFALRAMVGPADARDRPDQRRPGRRVATG